MSNETDIQGTAEESHPILKTRPTRAKCVKIVGLFILFYITVTSIVANIQLAANLHLCGDVYNKTSQFHPDGKDTLDCEPVYKFLLTREFFVSICMRGPFPFLQLREISQNGSVKRFEINIYRWMILKRTAQRETQTFPQIQNYTGME